MHDGNQYSVDTAREAAERDDLATWVAEFLGSPGSDNAPLAEELTGRHRAWLGPVELPLDRLHRLAGPADAPSLVTLDEDDWRDDVDDLGESVEEGWEPPPVIVSYRAGQLVLEDGNHRVEGLRRGGRAQAWAVIGFEDPDDRDRFTVPDEGDSDVVPG
jgi:hypothetical protein